MHAALANRGIERKPEYDEYGRFTGEFYWECACGFAAMYRRDVEAHDCREV